MKLSRFEKAYIIFISVCVALSVIFLIYVGIVVTDYDKAQPEHTVETQLRWLSGIAKDGTLGQELDFEKYCTNPYESNDANALLKSYCKKLSNGTLTYEISAAESGDLSKVYSVLADGVLVGKLRLAGENARTSLFFFTMADWSLEEFIPYPAETVYNLTLYCPDEVSVTVNGITPSSADSESGDGVQVYSVSGLLAEPKIEYLRADGTAVNCTTDGNTIKPAVYDYRFMLPSDLSVTVNGTAIKGEAADGDAYTYTVRDMTKPEVLLLDKCGGVVRYDGTVSSDELYTQRSVVVPQDFTVEINGVAADSIAEPWLSEHTDAQALLAQAGVQLPDMKTYEFVTVAGEASAKVTDSSGTSETYTLPAEGSLWLNGLTTGEIPESISAEFDVLEAAQCWSKFMTDDLGGAQHGLAEVRKYLLKTSAYYDYAEQWATGIDITFTSVHTLDGFVNEKVSNVTIYSDTCFSCNIFFEKNMTLYRDGAYMGERTDTFNSIVYFVYADDTPDNGVDDPHWAIAVMHDVI